MPAKVQSMNLPLNIFGDEDTGTFSMPSRGAALSDNDSPLYTTDEFRMYCFKVLPCSKRYCHDWTTCPFAHPGEKAKRRDPRLFSYTGTACPEMKKNLQCPRGESCPYAHNVFEYWLHPSRYRTQLCNDGSNCKRKVCFFAHSLEELRMPASKPPVNHYGMEDAENTVQTYASGAAEDPFAYGHHGNQSYASSPVSVLSRDAWEVNSSGSNSSSTPPNSWAPAYLPQAVNPDTRAAASGVSAAVQAAVAAASTAASVNALASKISELNLNTAEQQSLIDFLKSVVSEVGKSRPANAVGSMPMQRIANHGLEGGLLRHQSTAAAYAGMPALSSPPAAPLSSSAPTLLPPRELRSSKSLPFPLRHAPVPEECVTNSNIAQMGAAYRTLSASDHYGNDAFLRNLDAYSKMLQAAGGQQHQKTPPAEPELQIASGSSFTASSSSHEDDAYTPDQSSPIYTSQGISADMLFKYLHGQMS